ncbi:MAG: DNA-3-methyladenine glycosylase [Thermoanaerobaculales bacterium]|jgi:DNA-3-methyladenine glycosylase|nr:DNA-3-methyladenine glycosylase [Thermoanaerobaculales bacterium]
MSEPIHDLLSPGDLLRMSVLTRGFYQRPTVDVARELLGKIVIRSAEGGLVALRITEVEAYLGESDPACHTYGGRRTRRTETMWGPAGAAYVYLIYGIHSCLNVVTVGEGVPEAVLVRGGAPVAGIDLIRRRRGARVPVSRLSDGPGKLCQALAVDRGQDGADLCRRESGIWFVDDPDRAEPVIRAAARVGIDYAGEAAAWPLRFLAHGFQSPASE